MLDVALFVSQAFAVALIVYNQVTALWGLSTPSAALAGNRQRAFRVIVPAHDEASVLGALLQDIAAQRYPSSLVSAWVLADRCTDDTVSIARRAGVAVAARESGPGGKGAALRWYLEAHPLADHEVLVVVDADNRLPPDMLARFADELDAGHGVLQAYLDIVEPEGPWLVRASALSYWAGNRMVQLARRNLGWPADLGGTGMAIPSTVLQRVGGMDQSLTEDQGLLAVLTVAGIDVCWLHDVRIRDEKPRRLRVAVQQRARWAQGKREVARRYAWPLLGAAVRRRSLAPVDVLVRLVQPSRSFMALVSAVLFGAAAYFPSGPLWPAAVWGAIAALQFLSPLPFLMRDGVPPRLIAQYPLLAVFGILWVPVRVLAALGSREWSHTPHGTGGKPSQGPVSQDDAR